VANRPCPSFLIFEDQKGYWRWNFADAAGRIVAASTIAFARPAGCVRTIKQIRGAAPLPVLLLRWQEPQLEEQPPAQDAGNGARAGEQVQEMLDLKLDQILH
jgi:uncharacterized protein YegP (UPF0339 family)